MGKLQVSVIQTRNVSTRDNYIVIVFIGKEHMKSNVVSASNPMINERFTFNADSSQLLQVQIVTVSGEILGVGFMTLALLPSQQNVNTWIHVSPVAEINLDLYAEQLDFEMSGSVQYAPSAPQGIAPQAPPVHIQPTSQYTPQYGQATVQIHPTPQDATQYEQATTPPYSYPPPPPSAYQQPSYYKNRGCGSDRLFRSGGC